MSAAATMSLTFQRPDKTFSMDLAVIDDDRVTTNKIYNLLAVILKPSPNFDLVYKSDVITKSEKLATWCKRNAPFSKEHPIMIRFANTK